MDRPNTHQGLFSFEFDSFDTAGHDLEVINSDTDDDRQNTPDEVLEIGEMESEEELVEYEPADEDLETDSDPEPVAAAPQPEPVNDSTTEDDGQTCTICFEGWTSSGEHRLASLRCGHIFGRSCIARWLKTPGSKCPQCNAKARKSEIRNIYARTLKAIDSNERDKTLRELQIEKEGRAQAEMNLVSTRVKLMLSEQECERLKMEISKMRRILCHVKNQKFDNASQSKQCGFTFETSIQISKTGGCRVIAISNLLGLILVSQPSTNELFSGFGFRKITPEMKPSDFVLNHQKSIKDMAFHTYDSLVITASMDKTIKITNVLTNSVVQSYSLNTEAWSCCWDTDNPSYFFAGLKTGEVLLFDIRQTSSHLQVLPKFGGGTPVVSLEYLRKPQFSPHGTSGLLVGKLSDCGFYQKPNGDVSADNYKVVNVPTMGPCNSLSSEPLSGHFLMTCRPSGRQPNLSHTVFEMVESQAGQDITVNPVFTMVGGKTQLQISKSKLTVHPTDPSSMLVCAGDEDAHGALVYDVSSADQIDCLKSESTVLHVADMKNNNQLHMFTLTDKNLRVYKWNNK